MMLAAISSPLLGQNRVSLDPEKRITQYVRSSWQTHDGLPQNSVSSIVQDRNGYLWLGTEEGLVRFDGLDFEIYDKRTVEAFRSNDVVRLLADRQGRLWIGTRGAGAVVYENDRFSLVDTTKGLSSGYITSLFEDTHGRIWLGTFGGGITTIDPDGSTRSYGESEGLGGQIVSAIYEDQTGELWIGTDTGLYTFAQNRFEAFLKEPATRAFITLIFADQRERLWIGTRDSGLFMMAGDSLWRPSTPQMAGYASSIVQDLEESIWIGTSRGQLWRFRDQEVEFIGEDEFDRSGIHALIEDKEGSLWIGTRGSGLHKIRNAPFTPFGEREGLSNDRIYSFSEDSTGAIWVGTGVGLNRIEDNAAVPFPFQSLFSNKEILSIHGNNQNGLWIGTYGEGLYYIGENRIDSFSAPVHLPSNRIFAIENDAKGHMWFGTDEGAVMYDQEAFTLIDGLPSRFITAIESSPSGAVWIATYDAGLVHFYNGRLTRFSTLDGLSSNTVLALHEDEAGVLWVGTYGGGLNRIENGLITSVSTRDGLFNDNVYVILEDDENRLWMTCNKGIFYVEKQALNRFAKAETARIESTVYNKQDGLRNPEATGGQQPAGLKSADGRLWFPTIEGLAVIDPLQQTVNFRLPNVVIEEFTSDEQTHTLDAKPVVLPPGSKRLSINFSALSLAVPERIQFRYKLEGIDTKWSTPDARREATYTNLPPGHYTFRVIASNNDGLWNQTGAAMAFYLKPHFYQTNWFRVLVIFCFAVLIFVIYRFRILTLQARQAELERIVESRTHDLRAEKEKTEQAKSIIEAQADKLRELDRFKTRFFANVSHEFRTPLTMIIGPLENILGGSYGELEENMYRQVRIMLRNAQRLLRLINQLLDLSKLEAGKMELRALRRNIVQFLESVLLSCTPLAENKNITLEFDSSDEDIGLYYEPDKLENVFYNLLSNALKFTPKGGSISFKCFKKPANDTYPEGFVEILVSDTGKGIPPDALEHIFDRFYQVDGSNTREHEGTGIGLALVNELVLLHKGIIEARSEVGVGTTFRICLPLGAAHLSKDQIIDDLHEDELMPISSVSVIAEMASESVGFDHENDAESKPAKRPFDSPNGEPRTVLIVDDNADVREYVSGILNEHFDVEMATDGVDGLEKVFAIKPDLVISDVMMPKMDGNELCRRIKENLELDHIPVILMTARATNELRIEGLEMGADDYITKPFNAKELLIRAHNLMLMRQQEKELKILNEELEEKVAEQLAQMLHERLKYEEELLAAKEKAESSSRLKSTILDNINHEFRTPIAGILGSSEILGMESGDEAQEFIGYIKESTLRLQNTLDAVVELSSIESHSLNLNITKIDFGSLVMDAAERFGAFAKKNGLSWHAEIPETPVYIEANEEAVLRILDHLLDNAVKFTQQGAVTMQLTEEAGRASLSVIDTGVGISKEFMPNLYTAFLQESDGISRAYEGIGIGLTIAKQLTDMLGGTLEAKSKKGEGSVFTLSFRALVNTSQNKLTGSDQ